MIRGGNLETNKLVILDIDYWHLTKTQNGSNMIVANAKYIIKEMILWQNAAHAHQVMDAQKIRIVV